MGDGQALQAWVAGRFDDDGNAGIFDADGEDFQLGSSTVEIYGYRCEET